MRSSSLWLIVVLCLCAADTCADDEVDFNRDVRPILSEKCLLCHGPDVDSQEAGLRLDRREAAIGVLESGDTAIVPGKPQQSALLQRVTTSDEDLRMPPSDHGARLTPAEIDILTRWIQQGARYDVHWSYTPPQRPAVPEIKGADADWPQNAIDNFIIRGLQRQGLKPSEPADRYAIARRVYLDLTGLPPTVEEVDQFVADQDPDAYANLVDALLQRPTFGEHWARKWLDLARYADSAGYADDPPRTIWAYRDWVIKAINSNMPFDQFTVEQLAGDLLPEPSDNQLIATAFHRNTLTNNEGGTQDEEFRNVAVVDRVNTTMAVWMGTTMACAQCHTHKYDPITQEEYFRFFAIFNNTQDNDQKNESPILKIYTDEQRDLKTRFEEQVERLETIINTSTAELVESQNAWEQRMQVPADWKTVRPSDVRRNENQPVEVLETGAVFVETPADRDTYTVSIPLTRDKQADGAQTIKAIRLETLPLNSLPGRGAGHGGGNFVITRVKAELVPENGAVPQGRFVRITNNGHKKILSLAEVQVFSGGTNIALSGKAIQDSMASGGPPENAIDGNTDGNYASKSVTHTKTVDDPWWEVDLGSMQPIHRIAIWNRTDNDLHTRLKDFTVRLLDANHRVVWEQLISESPKPSVDLSPGVSTHVSIGEVFADYHQPDFEPPDVLSGKTGKKDGWAVSGDITQSHQLVLVPQQPIVIDESAILRIAIEQNSTYEKHVLGHFRLSVTNDDSGIQRSRLPPELLVIVDKAPGQRSEDEKSRLAAYYRKNVAPELQNERTRYAAARKELNELQIGTTVPVLRELSENRRSTYLQHRGNYLDLGQEVQPGLPSVFFAGEDSSHFDRLKLAQWLTSSQNALTARVLANRFWETLFGRGIVVTSEEFGSQGELPTHPELLDWLATELMQNRWNTKAFIRQLVMSATYRQSAKLASDALNADPDNRWLSRGPRIRLSAEMVRDQALHVSGLLSSKMYGPPVKPPQPSMGLRAAFGSATDWETSKGEDRYRRAIYTTWRRSSPYPSMATFDAPNREVCTVRRNSTNTPLQSLVTLNDPVYVEAAQSLARIALNSTNSATEQLAVAFRRCLLRPPSAGELDALVSLYQQTLAGLAESPDDATSLAEDPLGDLPEGIAVAEAAAMTVVCNVLLNLDEMFLKR